MKNEQKSMNNKQTDIKYFIYVRKSSEDSERQVESIDGQLGSLKSLSLNKNVIEIFKEAKSAKSPDLRPQFGEMIRRIKLGDASGIICWKMDRLSRNPQESGILQQLLQDKVIKSIITSDKEYKPDDNALILSVENGVSNQFIRDLRNNTLRGLKNKVEKGWAPIIAPQGYLNDTESKTIVPDPERFDLIRQVWDLMLTGAYSPAEILDKANEEWGYKTRKMKRRGNRPMSSSEIYTIYNNIFYTGMFEYAGEIYQGKHIPMITMSEFEKVRAKLHVNTSPRTSKHEFAFTNLIKCPSCGCSFTAEKKRKTLKSTGETKEYIYYRCTRKSKNIECANKKPLTLDELEKQIDEKLGTLTILPEFRDWALEILNKENDHEIAERSKVYKMQQKTLNTIQTELDNLTKMRYRDLISDEEYLFAKGELQETVTELRKQIKCTEERTDKWLALTEKTFDFATYAQMNFRKADLKGRREILIDLGSNPIISDKILHIDSHKWLVPISEQYPAIKEAYLRLEPMKRHDTSINNEALQPILESWGDLWGLNP